MESKANCCLAIDRVGFGGGLTVHDDDEPGAGRKRTRTLILSGVGPDGIVVVDDNDGGAGGDGGDDIFAM